MTYPIVSLLLRYWICFVIMLTRINGQTMSVNPDLIKWIEASPDTVITLLTGEKIVVLESTDDVIARIIAFRRAILAGDHLATNLPNPCFSCSSVTSHLVNNSEDE